eukprot:2572981-Amphidinium_carterae.1
MHSFAQAPTNLKPIRNEATNELSRHKLLHKLLGVWGEDQLKNGTTRLFTRCENTRGLLVLGENNFHQVGSSSSTSVNKLYMRTHGQERCSMTQLANILRPTHICTSQASKKGVFKGSEGASQLPSSTCFHSTDRTIANVHFACMAWTSSVICSSLIEISKQPRNKLLTDNSNYQPTLTNLLGVHRNTNTSIYK